MAASMTTAEAKAKAYMLLAAEARERIEAETAALSRIARRVRLGRSARVAEARCRVKRRMRRLWIKIDADADSRELIRAGIVLWCGGSTD